MTVAASVIKDEERIRDRFATGAMAWHDHHTDLFDGTERLFKPGYAANLASSWVPALEGVEEKLPPRHGRSRGCRPARPRQPRPRRHVAARGTHGR